MSPPPFGHGLVHCCPPQGVGQEGLARRPGAVLTELTGGKVRHSGNPLGYRQARAAAGYKRADSAAEQV